MKHFRSHLEQIPTRDIGTALQQLYQDAELALGISHVCIPQGQQVIGDKVKIKRLSSLSGPHFWVHVYTSLPTSLAFQHYSLVMAVEKKPSKHFTTAARKLTSVWFLNYTMRMVPGQPLLINFKVIFCASKFCLYYGEVLNQICSKH